jgi:hypothetical protein
MLNTFDYDRGHGVYKSNRTVEMLQPFGNLVAVAGKPGLEIAEPRKILFKVDNYGFRNDNDYNNEKYLLVGDSFIVCSSTSQEYMLSAQLRNSYQISSYNLAFPASLHSYIRFIKQFANSHSNDFKVLLFLFEGNDFPIISKKKRDVANKDKEISHLKIMRKKIGLFFRELHTWRFFYSSYHLFKRKIWSEKYDNVTIYNLTSENGGKIGFLNDYIKVTQRPAYAGGEYFEDHLSRTDKIEYLFFIPTKYRVYYEFLDIEHHPPLPNAQWEYLSRVANKVGLKCINLTVPLQQESQRLLQVNKLTYWRDDTHWNQYGIAVAAKVIFELQKAQ